MPGSARGSAAASAQRHADVALGRAATASGTLHAARDAAETSRRPELSVLYREYRMSSRAKHRTVAVRAMDWANSDRLMPAIEAWPVCPARPVPDRKRTRLNSSH